VKSDAHLIVSNSPVQEFSVQTTLCGKELTRTGFVGTDEDLSSVSDFFRRLGKVCGKCLAKFEIRPGEQHVYGAVEAYLLLRKEERETDG
jgi:hypothetical protein